MRTHVMVLGLVVSLSTTAWAGNNDCKAPLVTYYKPSQLPDEVNTRCKIKDGKCTKIELKGYLYVPAQPIAVKPASAAAAVAASPSGSILFSLAGDRHPLLIFNHGSESDPGAKCAIGTYFAKLGFVVFVPHRRGHGESTGVSLDDYVTKYCSTPKQDGPCKMEYLHKQVNDLEEAIAYMKTATGGDGKLLVDGNRIAIAGHSFGGIVTVFANTEDLGQKVVIDGAGASQSWEGNDTARADMKDAVEHAVAPIYFFEPMNDHSIDATISLARTAGRSCRQYQATLYPAVDANKDGKITKADYSKDLDGNGTKFDPRDTAHGTFMNDTGLWGPPALEFMTRYFDNPAQPFDSLCDGTSHDPPDAKS